MSHFKIEPHVGVGPIKLGMTKAQVESVIGNSRFESNNRAEFVSGFFINFDTEGKVEFIELANSDEFEALYKGVNLHKLKANDALSIVLKEDSYDASDPELGYSYIFKKLQMSLWRGIVPEDESDIDGQYFEAVGIGRENYY